jgi:hypothetical protein
MAEPSRLAQSLSLLSGAASAVGRAASDPGVAAGEEGVGGGGAVGPASTEPSTLIRAAGALPSRSSPNHTVVCGNGISTPAASKRFFTSSL